MRTLSNTVAVLIATLFTVIVVYMGVEGMSRIPAVQTAATTLASSGALSTSVVALSTSAGSSGTQTCPRTGCTASSCHATGGGSGQMAERPTRGGSY